MTVTRWQISYGIAGRLVNNRRRCVLTVEAGAKTQTSRRAAPGEVEAAPGRKRNSRDDFLGNRIGGSAGYVSNSRAEEYTE